VGWTAVGSAPTLMSVEAMTDDVKLRVVSLRRRHHRRRGVVSPATDDNQNLAADTTATMTTLKDAHRAIFFFPSATSEDG